VGLIKSRVRTASGLWRHRDFVVFWTADSLSWVGNHITQLALPLVAVMTLDASAFQVGLLAAAGQAPLFLFGLFAGAWIERRRRRPILVWADLGRAMLLAIIPLAAWFDRLSINLLYVVAFAVGVLTVFFDVTYRSYLPSLVGRDKLTDANSKLEASASTAQVGGPFLGGVVVGVLGAPFAILVDAASFLGSAVLLRRIEAEEAAPEPHAGQSMWRQIGEGMGFVTRDATLRALAGCGAVTNFAGYIFLSMYILFMERELGLGATAIGFVFAAGGLGALIGALFAGRAAAQFGAGPAIVLGQLGFGVTGLLVPLAVLVPSVALPLVVAAEFLQWMTLLVYIINAVSLRQTITPDALQGRVNATFLFATRGVMPLGSLAGGVLGGLIGLPLTLVVGEIGMFLAVLLLLRSPLPSMRRPPAPPLPVSA
jgi:MFS family permease